MKQNNYLLLFVFSTFFFILMLVKDSKQYMFVSSYWAHCSNDIGGFNNYYHLVPEDTWVVAKKGGRITIRTVIKNNNTETIKDQRIKNNNLSKKILKFVNKNNKYTNKCNNIYFNNKFYGNTPVIFKVSEKIINRDKVYKIKILIFVINILFTIIFIFKLNKINVSRLLH